VSPAPYSSHPGPGSSRQPSDTKITVLKKYIFCSHIYLGGKGYLFRIESWSLKGQCHEIFDPRVFFHQTIPPRALISGPKPFRIWLRIRRENRFENCQNLIPRC
jgi:hypothetical protein